MITSAFKAIALKLLENLSDVQSNAGCNDFHLAEIMPDVEERRALMKQFEEYNGSPEDFDPEGNYEYVQDFVLTALLQEFIKKLPVT